MRLFNSWSRAKRCAKLNDMQIEVTFPEKISINFDNIYIPQNERQLLSDIVNYVSKNTSVKPHLGYCITGPVGIGKSSLTFALAKEANIPIISLDSIIFRTMESKNVAQTLELIFKTATQLKEDYGACIITFQNLHEVNEMDDSAFFYSALKKYIQNISDIFIFLLTPENELCVPVGLNENNFFATVISLTYPSLDIREKIFRDCIKRENIPVDENVSINRLAKDTIGETPLEIAYIVKEAYLFSRRQNHKTVTQEDFSETIMKRLAGEKNLKMTEKGKKIVAYHEAGHVIAGYFSNPEEYVLKRVEISPRNFGTLGLTAKDSDENKFSYFKEDYENSIIKSLGGFCAEEVIFSSHTSGVVEDLYFATVTANNMVKAYGMGESLGAVVIVKGVNDSVVSTSTADVEIITIVNDLLKKTFELIDEHKNYLIALAEALLEKEVILGSEIKDIFESVSKE